MPRQKDLEQKALNKAVITTLILDSIKQHGSSLLAKQKNTLIPLDPGTEKVYE